jgi:very-short-patch-repair endonuclease
MAYIETMKNGYKVRTITCAKCGKTDTRRRQAGRKFCSLECYRASSKPERKTGKQRKCGACGKSIYVRQSAIKPINFCSVECFNKWQSKKDEYTCKTCGGAFRWSPSRASQSPKYCSIDCRNKCHEWKENAVIAGNLAQQNTKEPTSLEVAGCALLDLLGIEYETQVLICNKFVVDVLIPARMLVIQWDGDYWHGYGDATDERQRKRKRLDKSQDAYMRKAGYTILRFWEHEVHKEKEKVVENIKASI